MTIQREDGQAVTYDPKRLKGVNVDREMQKDFAAGDRIQFTAKDKDLGVNNRDSETITRLESGQITVRMDGKNERTIQFDSSLDIFHARRRWPHRSVSRPRKTATRFSQGHRHHGPI